jgi:CubicO group peptidase (beta-lactamase class C family)
MTENGHGALANRLGELLGSRNSVAAIAVVNPDGASVATRGTGLESDFEIGSISKGFTGLLYADALSRGEITTESTLGDFLPIGNAPAAGVSLQSLSIHSSGLPRLPKSTLTFRRSMDVWRHGSNPYGETLDELIEQARGATLGKPRARYSNFGFELLGHAVASAAGMTYTDLLRRRVTEPLALEHTYAPSSPDELRPEAVAGTSRHGRPQQPWTGEALAPAGGIRATIGDMARLTEALLDGSAPGTAALDPVAPFGVGAKIGAAWLTVSVKHQEITWHNGGTGGFRSWMGMNRSAGTGVVILSATASSVDRHGFRLLTDPSPRSVLT